MIDVLVMNNVEVGGWSYGFSLATNIGSGRGSRAGSRRDRGGSGSDNAGDVGSNGSGVRAQLSNNGLDLISGLHIEISIICPLSTLSGDSLTAVAVPVA